MMISILFVGVGLLITGTSALGIFISRKNKSVKNFTSKTSTLIFVTILTILAFFFTYASTKDIAYSVGGASIRLAEGQSDNQDYQTGTAYDRDNTVLSVSLAF